MQSLSLTDPSEIAPARRAVGALAQMLGFTAEDAGRAALVATEICTNIIKHGGTGELLAHAVQDDERRGVQLIGLDHGPGMLDVAKCLADGFSSSGSPGTGLGAIGRLSQVFDLYSRPDRGTALLAQLWPDGRASSIATLEIGAIVVPKPGETECGDAWCYAARPGGALLLGVDGLGHGLGAAQAAAAARHTFEQEQHLSPGALLEKIHAVLRTTRGAAVSLIEIDWNQGRLVAAGIGNLVAAIVTDQHIKRIASDNGIVGHAAPRIRELTYPVDPGAVLVLHSDGLATGWQSAQYPGLMHHHAALVAGVLYRDCKRGRDDCLAVVLKRATQ